MSEHKPESSHAHHPPEGSIAWYFHEFWPIMVFGGLFLLMMAVPVSLSFLFGAADKYGQHAQTDWTYGLQFIAMFAGTWLLAFFAPRWLGLYIAAMGTLYLVMAEGSTATNWGKSIAATFIGFALVGQFLLPAMKNRD